MGPPASHRVSRVRWYSGYTPAHQHFAYGTVTLCGRPFQVASAILTSLYECPQPRRQVFGLGSSHFARRYFGNRGFFLFLRVLRCFSSPRFRRTAMDLRCGTHALPCVGCPIRRSADRWIFAPHRSFSQLITSFIGSQCQGIHLMLFLT